MRGEQRKHAIALAVQRLEHDPLQQHVAVRVADDVFGDAIATRVNVHRLVGRHAARHAARAVFGVALFFGEKTIAVGDDETKVARTGLIRAPIIDLVEDPWLMVNQIWLMAVSAVPIPVFALEVQRASIPGHPGAAELAE